MNAPNLNSPNSPVRAAVALGLAVLLALTLTGGLFVWLQADIQSARESALRRVVAEALSAVPHDNNPLAERRPPELNSSLQSAEIGELFPARKEGKIVAVAVRARARGYGGTMEFVAAYRVGESAPLNLIILRHRETPGIADFLNDPSGGMRALDGVAGATVTSRAAREAVAEIGEYLRRAGAGKN